MDLTKRNSGLDLIRTTAILLVLIGHLKCTFYKMEVYLVENVKWMSETKSGWYICSIILYTSIFSYSIYLIHIPIYQSLVSNLDFFSIVWWMQVIVAIGIIYLLAYLLYFFFELPILKWRDRITTQKKKYD
jgi:peptidoglycan/LPS O-acetylase OafA/YrhL